MSRAAGAGAGAGADAGADLARHIHRVAVLIGAGASPSSAWRHTARAASPSDPRLDALVSALDEGASMAAALDRGSGSADWAALAAAWRVAGATGAPLAPALRAFAGAMRDRSAAERDIEVALAAPRATARIVQLLPAIAVALALLTGADLIAALHHPIGAGAACLGIVLALLGRGWMRRLVRRAEPPPPTAGLALDLLALAAGGGGSPEQARALVLRELRASGVAAGEDDAMLAALVELSRASGAPLGELARAEADEARRRARDDSRATAERLGVRLMLPLGACVLPSFLLLGVVPMLVGLISSTAAPGWS